ncbi:MAG: enoyl-CoA hydratase-related protein [Salinisphaera sp.]|nr:enoyl-CoA hydratase-related protein [Salinisphaera sp.]
MSADISYVEQSGVATITIDRPEVLNAFREQTMHELIEAFDTADASKAGVVVLTGAGDKAFSSGGDVAMEGEFDPAEGRRMARLLARLAEAIRGTGKPVIAKIRGWCVGGGNELNLMCDLAIAADDARFRHTDAKLGSSPIWYATQLLPLSVGLRRTKEILMLGEAMSAVEAQQIGWINKVVPAAELDDATQQWCERLLAASPQALRLTKISLEFQADMLTPSVRHGFEALTYIYGTEEFREGTAAYLDKRPPRFGR